MTDFSLFHEGSICLLTPLSESAHDWVSEHLPNDALRLGPSIAVESRYIGDIVAGLQNDGLTIEGRERPR